MKRKFKLYNLNFGDVTDFDPFSIDGYTFFPIKEKQPQQTVTFNDIKYYRKMTLNARVTIPTRQKASILFKEFNNFSNRKIKYLEDLLMLISICIGRLKYNEKELNFPIVPSKHCHRVANNSNKLKSYLEKATSKIQDTEWQQKYDNGFHIISFYNASNVYVKEPRFLADVTIWEYLYYCNNPINYDEPQRVSLNTKINFLVKEYILPAISSIPEEKLRIFSDLRNQLSQNGKFPITNPNSRFSQLNNNSLDQYMRLFKHLTQILVLRTLGIDSIDEISSDDTPSVRSDLEELINNGEINSFSFVIHRLY